MQKGSGQWSVISGQFGLSRFAEPCEDAVFEFLWRCADGSAVIGVWDFPQHCVAIAGLDAVRVAERNVAIDLTVNQKDWDSRDRDGIFRRDLLHVETVLRPNVEESKLDNGAEESSSEPGAEAKGLAHAVVSDLAEAGEGRFGGDGAEVRLNREGLQELGRAHGFSESVDAVWVSLRNEEVKPLVNVVAFQKAVGGELTSTCAVGARIGEQDRESVSEEELGVSGHADTIVAESVEQHHGIAVAAMRMNGPGTERSGVRSGDGNTFEVRLEVLSDLAHCGFVFLSQRAAGGMHSAVCDIDAGYRAERQVECEEEQEAARSSGEAHWSL
jgi:hypothetical protein